MQGKWEYLLHWNCLLPQDFHMRASPWLWDVVLVPVFACQCIKKCIKIILLLWIKIGIMKSKNSPSYWRKYFPNEIWYDEKKKDKFCILFCVFMHCRNLKNLTQQEKDVAVSSDFLKIHLHLTFNLWLQLCVFLSKLDKTDNVFQRNIICFNPKMCC